MVLRFRLITLILLIIGISTYSIGQNTKKEAKNEKAPLKLVTQLDSVSYGLGIYLGSNLKQQGFGQINTDLFTAGIKDYQGNTQPVFDEKVASEVLSRYVLEQRKSKSGKNLEEGKQFLEKNKSVSGVVVLPSGLQYQIIKTGTGSKPSIDDKVTVNYHGTLLNGKVFDSSVDRGQPIQLSLNQVIEGWKEALQLMPVGSKWKLFIPSNLAYGENQQPGGIIEPNSVLIFEVELLSIDKDNPEAQQPAVQDNAAPKQ